MQDLPINFPPKRVVSLVPSLTETLFDLGFGSSIVAITDYCIHPSDQLAGLARVGGPLNPKLDEIKALNPDIVLVGREESTPEVVEWLQRNNIPVWVWFPKTVRDVIAGLWAIVELYRSDVAGMAVRSIEVSLEWAELALEEKKPVRYFCPIWQEEDTHGTIYWVTFNGDTYCNDLLRVVGGQNIFAERLRRYPLEADLGLISAENAGGRDVRYPRVTVKEVQAAQPELILLPSEPFLFTPEHCKRIAGILGDTPAVQRNKISLVDGTLISWYGTRMARALSTIPPLFEII